MDFEKLAQKHKDAVYRQMVRACGNYDDAEDVLIQALLSAYKALPTLKDEGASQAWLAIIGQRVCTRIKKREALRPVLSLSGFSPEDLEVPDTSADVEGAAETRNITECVKGAVSSLPEPMREVYELRELQGFKAEETAEKLGITVAAVKSRLHRAREHVRRQLDESVCGG